MTVTEGSLDEAWSRFDLTADGRRWLHAMVVMLNTGFEPAPKVLLLDGQDRAARRALAHQVATATNSRLVAITPADLMTGSPTDGAARVEAMWATARGADRCVLFIDECEVVFARRDGSVSDAVTTEIVKHFLPELDRARQQGRILVVGATQRVDRIDDAIRLRLGTPITIGASETSPLAQAQTPASALPPDAESSWDAVIVPEATLRQLKSLTQKWRHADVLREQHIAITNALLFGAPGTGKTYLARALATVSGLTFVPVHGSQLMGQYIGESGAKVLEVFERARRSRPSLILFDDLQWTVPSRQAGHTDPRTEEIVLELLTNLDLLKRGSDGICVLAATETPSRMDPSVLARFETRIELRNLALKSAGDSSRHSSALTPWRSISMAKCRS